MADDKTDAWRTSLLTSLRAMSEGSGHTETIIGIALSELEAAWNVSDEQKLAQAAYNEELASGGPDRLLKAKACAALINSAALLRLS